LRIAEIGEARGPAAKEIGVKHPAPTLKDERHVGMRPRRELHRTLEMLIDGRGNEHMLMGRGEPSCGEMQAGHHAG
jgi:hypothetical protein